MTDAELPPVDAAVTAALVAQHRAFLSFLERRVESRAVAEEILQSAFAKSVEKAAQLEDSESAVAWFYRLLRNAVVDHYRRRAAQERALERHGAELAHEAALGAEAERAVCACITGLLPTLKPEYAAVVQAVDLDGRSVADVARSLDVTANNLSVRLHRARQQLKARLESTCSTCAEHGCFDCSCS